MSRESIIRTLGTATAAAGCALLLSTQAMATDNPEDIIVYRDVPAHIPYREQPAGKTNSIDPSPDELLLGILGLDNNSNSNGGALGKVAALSDRDIDSLRATPGQMGASTGNGGAGFTDYLIGSNGKGSLQSQSLAGRLGGANSVGRTTTAATQDIDVRINNALLPLGGLVNLR